MKKTVALILLILGILCLSFAGYNYMTKGNDESNENKEDKENLNNKLEDESNSNDNDEKESDLSLDDPIVSMLSSKVIGIYTNDSVSLYNDYFYKKDKVELANENMSFKLSLAMEKSNENVLKTDENNKVYIEEADVKEAYYSLYGKNANYVQATFTINPCNEFNWSSESNRYEKLQGEGACGGATFGGTKSKLGYAKKIISENEEKVELYEYFFIIDGTPEDKEFKYYSDYNKTNLFATLDLTTKVDDNFFENFKDQLGIYKYTFIKEENETYSFVTVEKVK